MVLLVAVGSVGYLQNDTVSDFQRALTEDTNVEFIDMQSIRSEIFPVVGREDDTLWRVARIKDDEVFFTTFPSVEEAQNCYLASTDQCKDDALFLCGHDVIYYRGNNRDIFQILRRLSL